MGKKASLSEVKRVQIVILQKEGYSERQIKTQLKCSKTAVHNALVNVKNFGTYSDKKRFGRPQKTTPRDVHLMRRIAVRSPMNSSKKIRLPFLARGTYISASTVSRHLVSDFGLKSCKPAKKKQPYPCNKGNTTRLCEKTHYLDSCTVVPSAIFR